jgi:uncharacterized protein
VLTADLVGVRRRGDELRLVPVDDRRRAHIEALATALTRVAREHVGKTRDEVDDALDGAARGADGGGGEQRLTNAVLKLVRDGCRYDEPDPEPAQALRRDVFRRAAAARRTATAVAPFDRGALLAAVAAERGMAADDVEAGLYADRPARQRLLAFEGRPPAALAAGFTLSQAQAVLLRATKVTAVVRAADAGTYRQLFRTLKFLRLLPVATPAPGGGFRIELDGPFSLFQGGTRYGLQLGLALPVIAACDAWSIEADVAWGADRRALKFRADGGAVAPAHAAEPPALPDELASFVAAFDALASGWRIDREPAILDIPGAGMCVPDLAFVRARDGARVFFELLGFWSREAVWRRIDLVRAGLPHRILFAVSKTLRVGEAVLDDTTPTAALYVFTRVMNAKQVLARIEQLAAPT